MHAAAGEKKPIDTWKFSFVYGIHELRCAASIQGHRWTHPKCKNKANNVPSYMQHMASTMYCNFTHALIRNNNSYFFCGGAQHWLECSSASIHGHGFVWWSPTNSPNRFSELLLNTLYSSHFFCCTFQANFSIFHCVASFVGLPFFSLVGKNCHRFVSLSFSTCMFKFFDSVL